MRETGAVRGVWASRDFRWYWFGHTVSQFGSAVTLLALPLVALLQLGASSAQVGLLAAAGFLPYLLFTLPVGVLADRVRRRPLMIAADLARAAALVVVPVGIAGGWLGLAALFAVAFAVGAGNVVFDVCYLSVLPGLVDREELQPANAALEGSRSLAVMAGPGLGGLLVAAFRASGAIVADAVSYLVSAVSLAAVRRSEPVPEPEPDAPRGLSTLLVGGRQVLRSPLLRPQTAYLVVSNLLYGAYDAVLIVFMVRGLGLSGPAVGAALAVGNVGFVVGTLLSRRWGVRFGIGPVLVASSVLEAVGLGVVAAAPRTAALPVLVVGQMLSGFGVALFNLQSVSLRQAVTPPAMLGRVNAAVRFVAFGCVPLGAAAGGWLGGTFGLRDVLAAVAVLSLVGTAILAFSALRGVRTTPEVERVWAAAGG